MLTEMKRESYEPITHAELWRWISTLKYVELDTLLLFSLFSSDFRYHPANMFNESFRFETPQTNREWQKEIIIQTKKKFFFSKIDFSLTS